MIVVDVKSYDMYYALLDKFQIRFCMVRKKFWPLYVWACFAGPDWLAVTRLLQGMPNDLVSPRVDGRHRFTPPSQESRGQKRALRELPARRGR